LQERVLLAERALLYSFAFDFRTGDPYSFALKYNSAYKLMCEQQAFDWLTFAAQATTLCLQYPPSMLAVAALWFAQHLVHGEVGCSNTPKPFQICLLFSYPIFNLCCDVQIVSKLLSNFLHSR